MYTGNNNHLFWHNYFSNKLKSYDNYIMGMDDYCTPGKGGMYTVVGLNNSKTLFLVSLFFQFCFELKNSSTKINIFLENKYSLNYTNLNLNKYTFIFLSVLLIINLITLHI